MALDKKTVKKLDSQNVLGSIALTGEQADQAWYEAKRIKMPVSYSKVENVVVAGMGGSALGPHLVRCLFSDRISAPLQIVNDYKLPGYVDANTLVFLSSYSGTTEEVLSCAREAEERRAKIVFMSTGGKLAKLGEKNKWPGYVFEPTWNPCGQPRVGLGYAVFGTLGILYRAGLLKLGARDIEEMVFNLKKFTKIFNFETPTPKNSAKSMAARLKSKMIFLVGADFLEGNLHIMANQINETSKQFANYFLLPEINHHLLEGLSFPARPKQDMVFVFFESKKYLPSVQKRVGLTRKIVEKNKIKTLTYNLYAPTKLGQSMEVMMLGSFVSFYLGMLNNVDPAFIPWVNYLKQQLKK